MPAVVKIVVETSGGLDKVKSEVADLGNNAKSAGGGFNALQAAGTVAFAAIAAAAVAAAAATVKFVGDSVTAAGNFEASVNGLAAVTGSALADAGYSFDDVKDKALQLGQDTQFSAQQAIEAMTELAKGGVPVVDVMGEATDATLALAAAAGLDLAPAAEIVAKQLGVWSEEGVTAQQVADTLASAANASTVSVEELALGLANVGGTAKTAGVSFQDINQTLALIAPNFSSASDAGTSLKTFISRLIPTTDSATDAMVALGLATEDGKSKFFDAQGAFIGMEQAAALLQSATAGLSQEEKLLAFNTIFGSDAIRAAAAIANAGAPGFIAMGDAMNQAGGAAAAAAAKNQGFNFALEQMKGSMETLQIVIGSALLPVLTDLLNTAITPLINAVMGVAQALFDAGPMSSEFAESMNLVGQALGLPDGLLQNMVLTLQSLAQYFIAVVEDGDYLNDFLTNLPGPIQGVVMAIGMLISSFQSGGTATQALGNIVTQLSGIWQNLQIIIGSVVGVIQSIITVAFGAISGFIAAHGAEIQAAMQAAWTTIQGIITVVTQIVQATIGAWNAAINSDINNNMAAIQTIITGAWTAISGIIQGALQIIQGFLQVVLGAITGDWQTAWTGIENIALGVWNAISSLILGALEMIAGAMGTSLAEILSIWSNNFNQMVSIVTSIDWAGVGSAIIDGIVSGVKSAASSLASAAAQAAKDALDAAKSALGISSPSKVFAEQVGKPMGQGMAVGLMDTAPMVAAAAGATAGAATMGARSTVYNSTRNITYSPTYTGGVGAASDAGILNALAGV